MQMAQTEESELPVEIAETEKADKTSLFNLNELLEEISSQMTGETVEAPIRFSFIWHKIHFEGQVLHAEKSEFHTLNIVANIGHIPFSAEDKVRRKQLFKFFTPHFMTGKYTLDIHSRIRMTLLTEFSGQLNARRLMEILTITLIDLQEDLKSVTREIQSPN